jgi:uncharacterized protein YciI
MYFFVRTQNPRPTFHLDMTDDERATMQRHVAYWTQKGREGISVLFGPVMDPKGVYGMGVYKAESPEHMQALLAADPANGLLKYETAPMARVVIGSEMMS